MEDAETRLEFNKILGHHQTNRADFGSVAKEKIPPKQSHAYRNLLSSLVTESDDEEICQGYTNEFTWSVGKVVQFS